MMNEKTNMIEFDKNLAFQRSRELYQFAQTTGQFTEVLVVLKEPSCRRKMRQERKAKNFQAA